MKKIGKLFSAILMASALVVASTAFVNNTQVYAAEPPTTNTITVTGKGSIKVKPDIAYISVGVTTNNADAKTAQTENSKKMNSVIAKIKAMGVADKDIQTNGYYISPQYDYNNPDSKGQYKIVGYTVSNNVSLTIRNIDKVGEFLDAAIAAGANVTNGVEFSISDKTAYYDQALSAAIANAKAKGNTIAKAIGSTLGKPTAVVETSTYSAPVMYQAAGMNAKEMAADTRIESGELEVTATVQVTFAY